jgi:cell division septation protein DedD
LILFGAFTFLGGFLVGLSLGGPQAPSPVAVPQPYTVILPSGVPHPQSNAISVYPTQSEIGTLAGTTAAGIVSAITPANVPQFLAPLKGEVQGLAIQHAATAVEQAAQRKVAPVLQPTPGSPQSLAAPVASKPDNYAVRLGTFAAKENAKDLQNRLQALNYKTYLKKENSSEDTLYHVHSGKYETYATAAHAAQQFTKKSVPGTIVVKLPSDNTSGS